MTEWPNGGMAAHTAEKKILKDGSNTIKPFILGENGGQSTKIYNLIYSFKLVYICMLFKCASPAAISKVIFYWSGNRLIASFMWRCCRSLSRLLTISELLKEAKSNNKYSSIIAHGSMYAALTHWLLCHPLPPVSSLGLSSTSDVITFDQNWNHIYSTSAAGNNLPNDAQVRVIGLTEPEIPTKMFKKFSWKFSNSKQAQ